MIRLTTEVNGHQVTIEGTADEVVAELETLKKGLNEDCCSNGEPEEKAPKKSRRKSASKSDTESKGDGASTTAVDEQHAPEPAVETEPAPEEESASETPEAPATEITITDLRKAIQGASREQKQAAKQYLIDALGKADLPSLPEDKYHELMELVS